MQNRMWTIAKSYVSGTILPQHFDFASPVRMAPKPKGAVHEEATS